MAFCPNCGAQVAGKFCQNCGTDVTAAQAAGTAGAAGPIGATPGGSTYVPPAEAINAPGLTTNVASALCYLFWIITGIIFLVLSPYNRDRTVRFHAFQAIFATVAFIILQIILAIFSGVLGAIHMWALAGTIWTIYEILVFILWLYMMYTAYNNRKIVLPVIGPLAEKQA